jgi:hypothetical protein
MDDQVVAEERYGNLPYVEERAIVRKVAQRGFVKA